MAMGVNRYMFRPGAKIERFGFALEDIRQLLALYDLGDQRTTQIARTVALARARLDAMETQRAELDVAIAELRDQIAAAEAMLAERGQAAAE